MSDNDKDGVTIILKPDEVWKPITGIILPEGNRPVSRYDEAPKCTCGVDVVGTGKHSDYCDKA